MGGQGFGRAVTRADDMLDTVMERAGVSPSLRGVGWQQLVDLLSRRPDADGEATDRAFATLERWRNDTTAERRARACAAVADATLSPRLFAHLVQDGLPIAAPVLTRARLSDDALIELLPRLSGPSRALLRHREPLSPALARALAAFGPADLALSGTVSSRIEATLEEPVARADENNQDRSSAGRPVPIRDLVERIDRFRRTRPAPTRPAAPPPSAAQPRPERRASATDRFAFETARDGAIRWSDAPLRGAVIGLSLAEAVGEGAGVSQATAACFARRAPIRDAALALPAGTELAGVWRMEATPVFASSDGRFTGYVGHARRGGHASGDASWALARSDAFRQLMHELKTPLNAIVGFSELIEQQLLGPVPVGYRDEAAQVRRAGQNVLDALNDVDLSARLDAGASDIADDGEAHSDLTAVTASILADVNGSTDAPTFSSRLGEERIVAVPSAVAHRIVERLLSGLVPLAAPDERLDVWVTGRKRARLRIALPAGLRALDPDDLNAFRLPRGTDNGAGPLLGLEFTLRLVRRLAEEAGGGLSVSSDEFTLSLPVIVQNEVEHRR